MISRSVVRLKKASHKIWWHTDWLPPLPLVVTRNDARFRRLASSHVNSLSPYLLLARTTTTEEGSSGTAIDNKGQDSKSAGRPCASWIGEPARIHIRRARPACRKRDDVERIVRFPHMYTRSDCECNSKLWSQIVCVCAGTGTLLAYSTPQTSSRISF